MHPSNRFSNLNGVARSCLWALALSSGLACSEAPPRDSEESVMSNAPRFTGESSPGSEQDEAAPVESPSEPGILDGDGAGVGSNGEGSGAGVAGLVPSVDPAAGAGAAPPPESSMGAATTAPPSVDAPAMASGNSAGCGSTAVAAQGESSIVLGGVDAAYSVRLPPGYDPNVPVPLVFGFHGRDRTHLQFEQVDASGIQAELGSRAVMVYLKSQAGPGWNFPAEVEPNVAFFEALYPEMLSSYCIDTSRVFAVGHSSGGYFSNILACRYGDRLRGIASIAGQTQETGCVGRVAALVIHGVRDSVVSFAGGQASRDTYLATNGCSGAAVSSAVSPCVAYEGCDEGLPVQWCEHDEPTYQDTNHGWPSFASRAAGQFLFSLP